MNAPLGPRLRRLRRQQGLTLDQVAGRVGCTRSLLSKIETGACQPAMATLARIAAALGSTAAMLLSEDDAGGTAHSTAAATTKGLAATAKGYRMYAFATARGRKAMQPMLFTARRGEITAGELHHGGEEFVLVLAGRLRYRVGAVHYDLGPGDSLYFDAEEPHDVAPLSAEARWLAVFADHHGTAP